MVIKWAGIGLVLFSGTGWGMWMAWRWRARLEALETLRQMIFGLKGEITYSRAPLEEALERVGTGLGKWILGPFIYRSG